MSQYWHYKSLGLCPACGKREPLLDRRLCGHCQEAQDRHADQMGHHYRRELRELREERRQQPVECEAHEIAHCGAWHPITAIPFACPSCQRPVLAEA